MSRRPGRLILGIIVVATAITVLPYALRNVRTAYVSLELRVAVETAQGLVALLLTHLFFGRYTRTRERRDLLLAYGLGLFGAASLALGLLPVAGSSERISALRTWWPLAIRMLGTVAIAWAAWAPSGRTRPRRPALTLLTAHVVSLAVLAVAIVLVLRRLPPGVEVTQSPSGSVRPALDAHPVLLGAQVVLMLLYWVAAAGFVRRARLEASAVTIALAAGFVLAGFSRLNFLLYPSLYTNVVHAGDLLRLAAYSALLLGAEREIRSYWEGLASTAVKEERRRTARDLHDGLVQELSFIRSRVSSLDGGRHSDGIAVEQLVGAADRALDESRRAVQALSGADRGSAETVLRRAAEEVATRAGAATRVDADPSITLSPAATEALSRIVREACSNAVRHGKAQSITIRLERKGKGAVSVTVADDGAGFDPERTRPDSTGGFGLTTMRDRALGLGGRFNVVSTPGNGTRIEVVLPAS